MTPHLATSFGERLRSYRERAGLTQEELAEKAGVTASAIGALERGIRRRPYPNTIRLLSTALGLTVEEDAAFAVAVPRRGSAQAGDADPAPSVPPTSNLPLRRAALFGRRREIAALNDLVRHRGPRLITLTGVGGCGKTSLALHVAGEVQAAFAGGVWVAELAAVADPALVAHAVAAVLDVRESPGVPLLDTLVAVLRTRTLLLVLDNCEHLLDGCTRLADRLLATCPNVRILATSREPLQIAGERQWRVSPLAVPDSDLSASLQALARYPSVQLFVERAQAVASGFRLIDANAAAVAQICTRLTGIPLALELAAARVRVLGVEQIVERLDDTLRLLTGGSRAAPTRQQTLRAAMDWSYDLLTEPERGLYRRLAIFAGGFDFEAADCVGGGDGDLDVLDLLTALVDKSLVVVEEQGGAVRYHLLEPVRQHAAQHLAASGENETAGARHAAFYLDLAEQAEPELRGPDQVAWLGRLDREQDNLRAALRWMQARGDAESGLRLAGAMVGFWEGRGYLSEGRRWLAAVLAITLEATTPFYPRMKALIGAGALAQWQADLDAAVTSFDKSLAIARALDDEQGIAGSLAWLGAIAMRRNATTQAVELIEESLALYRDCGETPGIAFGLLVLGVTVGNGGDLSRSLTLLEESVSLFRQLGDVRYIAITLTMLGAMSRAQGDLRRATALLREAVTGHRAVGDRAFLIENLIQLAGVDLERGEGVRAARLLGAAEAARGALGVALAPTTRVTQEAFVAVLRAQLAEAEFTAAWAAGRAMTLDDAIAEALAIGRPAPPSLLPGATLPSDSPPIVLTRREGDVLRLLAREYTDRQIAAALGITAGTVGVHVHNILAKLGVRSRWQVADQARARGLLDRTMDQIPATG